MKIKIPDILNAWFELDDNMFVYPEGEITKVIGHSGKYMEAHGKYFWAPDELVSPMFFDYDDCIKDAEDLGIDYEIKENPFLEFRWYWSSDPKEEYAENITIERSSLCPE